MKFTYKERQDILWSLEENAKRLADMMTGYKNIEPAYERAEDQDGLKRVRDGYAEAERSRDRLQDLARKVEASR
jgi:hypothetical protein